MAKGCIPRERGGWNWPCDPGGLVSRLMHTFPLRLCKAKSGRLGDANEFRRMQKFRVGLCRYMYVWFWIAFQFVPHDLKKESNSLLERNIR